MPLKNRVKMEICGTEYTVTSEEAEGYMRELGAQLDHDMRTLMDNDRRVSTTMAAVLCALNNADRAEKANKTADNLRAQMKDYLDDNARARQDAENARREADRLRKEIQDLRKMLPSDKGMA